jgi:hypothetical protein
VEEADVLFAEACPLFAELAVAADLWPDPLRWRCAAIAGDEQSAELNTNTKLARRISTPEYLNPKCPGKFTRNSIGCLVELP